MRFYFIFISFSLLTSAKKYYDGYDDYEYYYYTEEETNEHVEFVSTVLDLRGSLRRQLALEAALLDHARNMICSPLSILMPLGKLAMGAKKKTLKELVSAFGLKNHKQIKTAFAQLITNMEFLPGVKLDVASRIYVSSTKFINQKYANATKTVFKSSVQKIRISKPAVVAKTINNWVSNKTRGKIKKLLTSSDITKRTSVILVNAIYFAGTWKHKFGYSYMDTFTSPSGSRPIPMMRRQGQYEYWKSDVLNAEVIQIPYKGEKCSMIIVLPFSNSGLPILLRALKLAPELLNDALEKMKTANVLLAMPKFKIESQLDLEHLLKKVGIKKIFDEEGADLSGIIKNEKLYVTKAVHKAVIEVNEKGTEGAAATGIEAVPVKFFLDIPIFNANRPFLFIVTFHKEQLFAGVFSG